MSWSCITRVATSPERSCTARQSKRHHGCLMHCQGKGGYVNWMPSLDSAHAASPSKVEPVASINVADSAELVEVYRTLGVIPAQRMTQQKNVRWTWGRK